MRLSRGLEPSHLSLPLPRRLVGDFRPIVFVLLGAVNDGRHDTPVSCGITPQLVGDQPPGRAALSLQQLPKEALRRTLITTRLDEDIDHITILINCTPEILPLTLDSDEHLIQVPRVAQATLSPLERPGVVGTELQAPLADSLMRDVMPRCESKSSMSRKLKQKR